jgi:phospholipid transport system substrate-binding protein
MAPNEHFGRLNVFGLVATGLLPASSVAALLVATLLVSGAVAAASDNAAAFVRKSASEAIAILSNGSLPDKERRAQFRRVILETFDAATIGRVVVERYWTQATPDQQGRFQTIFQGALVGIYTERFFEYDGHSLQIKGTRAGTTGSMIVETTIATPTSGKTYDVDWIVTGPAGKEKFLDVVIDGISTSVTTQQDYGSVLRSSNGNLDALTAALKAKGN